MPGVAITGRGLTRNYPAGERPLTALDHVEFDVEAGSSWQSPALPARGSPRRPTSSVGWPS